MRLVRQLYMAAFLLPLLPAFGDDTGMLRTDRESLAPMETIQITVHDANSSCTINVLTPTGHLQSFAGTISNGNATASYTPSYLLGVYEVSAVADGNMTETDSFTVASPNIGASVQIEEWSTDKGFYRPQENLTFTFELADSQGSALTGFTKDLSDTRYDSDSGRLSILREVTDVAADGTITARVLVYFDTTGRWSNIYAPTTVKLGLYYKDGGPLPGDITLANGTLNNEGGNISTQLIKENSIDKLVTDVVTGFAGSDKIGYVEVVIPPSRSLSEVIFAVEYIRYYYNTGWADRIYITEKYVDAAGSGFELDTGDSFSSLGRLPVFLPLTPNENGLVYYGIHSDDLPGTTNFNDGTFSEDSGAYTNVWTWNSFVSTTADCYVYADKWGYDAHGFAGPITLESDPNAGLGQLRIEGYGANRNSYFPLEDIEFSFLLKDSADANVTGLTGQIADPLPTSDSGAFYVLREVLDVNEDGSSQGRLSVYFDTTGQWSDIYAGTTIEFSIYNRDGLTALTDEIALRAGFINNGGNALSSELSSNTWKVNVDTGFAGVDRIAYLDFDFPGTHSVSDVVVSVDRILYFRNSGWADKIVIANNTIADSAFPRNLNGQIEFTTG
ncbi:MAG: hypothetical protein JSU94_08275, partial [Phycisphaerales bacterium]